METTYEKDGDNLKIIEPVVSTISLVDLLAQQAAVQNDIANAEETYQTMSAVRAAQLAKVQTLIDQATQLGITPPAPEDDEPDEPSS